MDGCIKLLQEALEEHHMCLLKSIHSVFLFNMSNSVYFR